MLFARQVRPISRRDWDFFVLDHLGKDRVDAQNGSVRQGFLDADVNPFVALDFNPIIMITRKQARQKPPTVPEVTGLRKPSLDDLPAMMRQEKDSHAIDFLDGGGARLAPDHDMARVALRREAQSQFVEIRADPRTAGGTWHSGITLPGEEESHAYPGV